MKPEILDDDKTAGLSDAEYRMFQGIILLSDDHGSFRANAKWLASQIWWAREPSRDPRECLATLSRLSLVTLYEHSGQVYGHVTNWDRHQKIDHPSKPRLPQVTDPESRLITSNCKRAVGECATDSRESSEPVPRDSRLTSDLRSPISDLRTYGTDETVPVPSSELGIQSNQNPDPPEPLALSPQPKPPAKRPSPAKQPELMPSAPVGLAWSVWRKMYGSSRRKYGKYVENGDCKGAMSKVAERALSEAISELRARGLPGDPVEPVVLEVLKHWFASYLRDDGRDGFLADNRHPIRFILRSLSAYGTPWSRDRTVDPAEVDSARAAFEAARTSAATATRCA